MTHFKSKRDLPPDSAVPGRIENGKPTKRQRLFPRPGSIPIGTYATAKHLVFALADCSVAHSATHWRKAFTKTVKPHQQPVAEYRDRFGKIVSYYVFADWQVE